MADALAILCLVTLGYGAWLACCGALWCWARLSEWLERRGA